MKNKHLVESLKQLMTAHCSKDNGSHDGRYYTKKNVDNLLNNYTISWNSIADKPSVFPPVDHSHPYLSTSGGTISGTICMARNMIGITWGSVSGPGIFSTQSLGNGSDICISPGNNWQTNLGACVRFGRSNWNNDYCICTDDDNLYTLGTPDRRWKQIYARTSTIVTSDRNFKKDEKDFDDEFVTKLIMGLKPKTYKFKQNDSNRTHYGFIAQDIEDLLPELGISSKDISAFIKSPASNMSNDDTEEHPASVEDSDQNFIYSLRYEELISPMVRKMQIQEEKINNLQKQIDQLIQSK